MKGALYLRFLLEASTAFVRSPTKTRYAWLEKEATAKALKRALYFSPEMYRQIKDLRPDETFNWLFRNEYRYPLFRQIRTAKISELAMASDDFTKGFLQLNSAAEQELDKLQGLDAVEGSARQQATLKKVEANHLAFAGAFLGVNEAIPPHPDGRELAGEFRKASADSGPQAEPAGGEVEQHFVSLARGGVPTVGEIEVAKPSNGHYQPIINVNPPSGLASTIQRVESGPIGKGAINVVSAGERMGLAGLTRLSNFAGGMPGALGAGARMLGLGGGLAAKTGLAASGVGAPVAAVWLGVDLARKIPWTKIIIGCIAIFFIFLSYTQIAQTQPLLVVDENGQITLGGGNSSTGGNNQGGSCPTQATIDANKNPSTCKYLNPGVDIFDTKISDQAVQSYINKYSSVFINAGVGDLNEFSRRVRYIVAQSQKVGLNPVVFLGYWKSESMFSSLNAADLGCAPGQGRKPFEQEVNCAVGLSPDGNSIGGSVAARCASPKNPDKAACNPQINTLDQFAESYGPKAVDPNNCSHTYNILVEVAEELNACRVSGGSGITVGCPLSQFKVTCGSAAYPSNGCGHGAKDYGVCQSPPYAACPNGDFTPELKHAIDVVPADEVAANAPIYLPKVGGELLQWSRASSVFINGEWGYKIAYSSTTTGGDQLVLTMTHVQPSDVVLAQSGTQIASVWPQSSEGSGPHLHLELKVNDQPVELRDVGMCY